MYFFIDFACGDSTQATIVVTLQAMLVLSPRAALVITKGKPLRGFVQAYKVY